MRSQITMEFVDIVPQHDLPLYVSLSLLSTMAVGLRLIARIKTKNTLRGDDWSACLGLVLLQAFLGPSIWAMKKLDHLQDESDLQSEESYFVAEENLYIAMYAAGPITISTITAARISIVLLYRRVFLPDKSFRVASNVVGALCLLWGVVFVFVHLLHCTPIEAAWKAVPANCINSNAAFLGAEIIGCILDFAILLLPLRVIRKLRLPLTQKVILCFIFTMGSFIGVISIVRMAIVYPHNFLYGYLSGHRTNWLPIQLAMAVICCCLPTYRPLLPNGAAIMASLVGLHSAIGSLIPRKQRSASSSNNGSRNIDDESCTRSRHDHYSNLTDHDEGGMSVLTHVVGAGAGRMEDCVPRRDYPMDGINVTKTVDLV